MEGEVQGAQLGTAGWGEFGWRARVGVDGCGGPREIAAMHREENVLDRVPAPCLLICPKRMADWRTLENHPIWGSCRHSSWNLDALMDALPTTYFESGMPYASVAGANNAHAARGPRQKTTA